MVELTFLAPFVWLIQMMGMVAELTLPVLFEMFLIFCCISMIAVLTWSIEGCMKIDVNARYRDICTVDEFKARDADLKECERIGIFMTTSLSLLFVLFIIIYHPDAYLSQYVRWILGMVESIFSYISSIYY